MAVSFVTRKKYADESRRINKILDAENFIDVIVFVEEIRKVI